MVFFFLLQQTIIVRLHIVQILTQVEVIMRSRLIRLI